MLTTAQSHLVEHIVAITGLLIMTLWLLIACIKEGMSEHSDRNEHNAPSDNQ
jgi:hypothetical protein